MSCAYVFGGWRDLSIKAITPTSWHDVRMTNSSSVESTAVLVERTALTRAFEHTLQPSAFKDYGPNGLQVEGKSKVRKLVSGVTASLALIEAAVAADADAIVVHHGLFWRGQSGCVTGWMKQRLAALLRHDINLYAYHLPLDAHPELGNNAQLGLHLGFAPLPENEAWGHFGEQELGFLGLSPCVGVSELAAHVQQQLGRAIVVVNGGVQQRPLRRVAWCSGGAQSYFEAAIAAGADAFITGEISEPQAHYARECGVAYLACGHHASERYGVQALGTHIAAQFGLVHEFIDIDNPA